MEPNTDIFMYDASKVGHERSIPFEVRAMDDETGIFEGYASAFNIVLPFYNEMVLPGAFTKTIKESKGGRVPILANHWSVDWIGNGREAIEDKKGLKVVGQLLKDEIRVAAESWALMKHTLDLGVPAGLSIGFRVMKDRIETIKGQAIRMIEEIQLLEYSFTPFPANPKARIVKVRSLCEDIQRCTHHELAIIRAAVNSTQGLADGEIEPDEIHSLNPVKDAISQFREKVEVFTK